MAELENALGHYCFESIKEYETYMVRFSGPSRRSTLVDTHIEQPQQHKAYVPNQVK